MQGYSQVKVLYIVVFPDIERTQQYKIRADVEQIVPFITNKLTLMKRAVWLPYYT